MFEVKVKTLDGRNTSFSVEDEITVAEFKAKISEEVDIQADRQRLIFTGKVLNDNNTLKSYNVADKVIHVVNRAPPLPSNNASSAAASNTATSTTGSRGNHNRPSVSMSAVPSNMLGDVMNSVMSGLPGDALVHHIDLRRSTTVHGSQHTESGRRVVLVRQWIRDSHSLLDRIRNPSQGTRLTADSQTAEARSVSQLLPHVQGESISVSVSTSGMPRPTPAAVTRPATAAARPAAAVASTSQSQPTTRTTPATAAAQGRQPPAGSDTTPPINPHVEVLSSLWGEVDTLNARLHPHMHHYRELLVNPGAGCPGHNQHLFDTVSSVTHNMAHIWHALSDLNCDFRSEANRELTAAVAPAPPPTAIIQQTIPVTIPLRATLNVSPRTARRRIANPTSITSSTTTSSAVRPPSGQPSYTPTTSTGVAMGTSPDGGMFTSIELDMETDSGEDISEDGQPPESGQSATGQLPESGQPAAGQPTNSIPEQLRNFNLSQIIQDAFSGMTGMGGLPGGPQNTTTVTGATAVSASVAAATATPAAASSISSGMFGPFIPPPGSATTSNGPVLAGGAQLPGMPAGFPAGIPPSALPPGFSFPSSHQVPRDRQDPYLSSCASKHWSAPQPNRLGHTHQAATSGPQLQPRGAPTTNTASRGTTTVPSTTQGVNTSNNQRETTTTITTPRTTSDASIASNTTTESSNMRSSAAAETGERRIFYEEISAYMAEAVRELERSELRDPLAASDLQKLNQRMEDMFKKASDNHRPSVTIAEIDRIIGESSSSEAQSSPSLGLLGELCTLLFKDLTLSDVFRAYTGQGRCFDRLRGPLRRFARSNVLQDGPHTQENMSAAVDRLMVSIREQIHACLIEMSHVGTGSSPYHIESSLCSYIRSWVLDILNFITISKEGTENYGDQLLARLHQGLSHFLRLSYELFEGCSSTTESWRLANLTVSKLIEHCTSSRRLLGQALSQFAVNHLQADQYTSTVRSIPLTSLKCHMISSTQSTASPMHTDAHSTGSSDYQDAEAEANQAAAASNIHGSSSTSTVSPSPLSPLSPSTLSEASATDWRTVIPADWVAIIEEDIKRQLRLESNSEVLPPLSDTYLNARPQKRRKLSEAGDEQE